MRPKIVEVSMYKDGQYRDCELFGLKTSKCVSLVRVDGDIYFANSSHFEDEILNLVSEKIKLKVIIFDFGWINNIDSTGLKMFENLIERLQNMGIKIYLTNVRVSVTEKFHHIGFLETFGVKNIFTHTDEAIEYVIEKFGDFTDVKILSKYKKDKKKKPELDKKIINKIDKI